MDLIGSYVGSRENLNLSTSLALENTVVTVCTICSRVQESEFPSHIVLMCFI